jgi:hypothetical protein
MSILDDTQKLDLKNLINANDTKDCTQEIRDRNQSKLIKNDIKQLMYTKDKYKRLSKTNPQEFSNICINQARFLYNNYTDIFNKIKKDIIDLNILDFFLKTLKKIEDGEVDQHEGSYLVGELLKKIYVDSALRREKKLDEKNTSSSKKKREVKEKNISYSEYKKLIENCEREKSK